MAPTKPSSVVQQLINKFQLKIAADHFILAGRFLLIVFNYLIILYWWQPKVLDDLYLAIVSALVICYGLITLIAARFIALKNINLILTLFEILIISLICYLSLGIITGDLFFLCLIGITVNVFYAGFLSGIILSILASIAFSIIFFPTINQNTIFLFYLRLLNLNLATLIICFIGFKVKQMIKNVETEKAESKKQYQQLQVLSRIAKEINGELEIDKLLLMIVQKAGELTKSQTGGIILKDSDQIYRIKATNGMPKSFWGKEIYPADGLFGKVLSEKKTILDRNFSFPNEEDSLNHYNYAIASPIWRKNEILGLIFLLRGRQSTNYNKDDRLLLETLSENAANAVTNANLFKHTAFMSLNDYLTGVGNLRFFYQQLEHTFAVAERYQQPFSLMIVDSDSLKQINDQYGNSQGFRHIKQLAEILKNTIRNSDMIARYDRDMFMIILPQTNLEETIKLAERIRGNIANSPLIIDGQSIYATVCIGLASFSTHAKNIQNLISVVETALHKAKRRGKNQVVSPE